MALEQDQYHIFFLPFMASGHMIPCLDMARLFTSRMIKSTIVTTQANLPFFLETIKIELLTMKFPHEEVGLPQGCENIDSITCSDMLLKFFSALPLFQQPFENLIEKFQPDCIIADYFFPWVNSTACKYGIPCLSFSGFGYFSHSIIHNLFHFEPYKNVSSDVEIFVVPGKLPHEIELSRSEMSPVHKGEGSKFVREYWARVLEAQRSCYGLIFNSFYELEPEYVEYVGKEKDIKNWHIGPFSLWLKQSENGPNKKGKKYGIDEDECLKWLDEKETNSVVYICFGSASSVIDAQLHEIALALEVLLELNFILVVRKLDNEEKWVPHGFEEGVNDRCLIIRGWAPQEVILGHRAVGGFVTHCGWNSILDGVTSGVPMLTWPLHGEQFYNEKLVTNVLKIGVQVGSKKCLARIGGEHVIIENEKIVEGIKCLMIGDDAKTIRNRAKELKDLAKGAISKGGSSFSDLDALITELKSIKNST